jgi:hypothetical protein
MAKGSPEAQDWVSLGADVPLSCADYTNYSFTGFSGKNPFQAISTCSYFLLEVVRQLLKAIKQEQHLLID